MNATTLTSLLAAVASVAGVGIAFWAILDGRAPLRRFERLAAARGHLEAGSREQRLTDKAILHLARRIATGETSNTASLRTIAFLLTMTMFGALLLAVGASRSTNSTLDPRWAEFLYFLGALYFLCGLLSLVLGAASWIISWMTFWKYRRIRRLIRRSIEMDRAEAQNARQVRGQQKLKRLTQKVSQKPTTPVREQCEFSSPLDMETAQSTATGERR